MDNPDNLPVVLVVDDDEPTRLLMTYILRDHFVVQTVSNGLMALAVAKQKPQPDLIMLDVLMPGMSGYEVCERLKSNRRTADIPVLFVSSLDDEGSEYQGLQLGADDYLTKPLNPHLTRLRVRRLIESRRKSAQLRLAAKVVEHACEGVLITNENLEIVEVNDAVLRLTGYSRIELIGKNPRIFQSGRQDALFYRKMWDALSTSGNWQGEIWNRKKTGEVYAEYLSITALRDSYGEITHYMAIFSDITATKEYESKLQRVAFYDTLTGLPNRLLLMDRMRHAITRAKRDQCLLCVCYMDLDGFKLINDSQGHAAGDAALVEVSQRIQTAIRSEDTLARLGGDEFVVLFEGFKEARSCQVFLERILEEISYPLETLNQPATLGVSIGVAIYPLDSEQFDILLHQADQAMYQSKQEGKHRFHFHNQQHVLG